MVFGGPTLLQDNDFRAGGGVLYAFGFSLARVGEFHLRSLTHRAKQGGVPHRRRFWLFGRTDIAAQGPQATEHRLDQQSGLSQRNGRSGVF